MSRSRSRYWAARRGPEQIPGRWRRVVEGSQRGGGLRSAPHIIPDAKLALMHAAVIRSCATDGKNYLTDPLSCNWRAEELQCRKTDGASCLTAAQVRVADDLYRGPVIPSSGQSIFPGLLRGSELGWHDFMAAAGDPPPLLGLLRGILGEDFNWRQSDWNRDATTVIAIMSRYWDANRRNIDDLAEGGGKILMYTGWADAVSSPIDTIDYFDGAQERLVAATEELGQSAPDAIRLFMVPGMTHCRGGNGPDTFDGLDALAAWVEKDRPPRALLATGAAGAEGVKSPEQELCPYPQVGARIGGPSGRWTCGFPNAGSTYLH